MAEFDYSKVKHYKFYGFVSSFNVNTCIFVIKTHFCILLIFRLCLLQQCIKKAKQTSFEICFSFDLMIGFTKFL